MTLHLLHFSVFRDARGCDAERVETDAQTPLALWAELFGPGAPGASVPDRPEAWARVAVNDAFAGWNARLAEGDTVVFLAPSAGG